MRKSNIFYPFGMYTYHGVRKDRFLKNHEYVLKEWSLSQLLSSCSKSTIKALVFLTDSSLSGFCMIGALIVIGLGIFSYSEKIAYSKAERRHLMMVWLWLWSQHNKRSTIICIVNFEQFSGILLLALTL